MTVVYRARAEWVTLPNRGALHRVYLPRYPPKRSVAAAAAGLLMKFLAATEDVPAESADLATKVFGSDPGGVAPRRPCISCRGLHGIALKCRKWRPHLVLLLLAPLREFGHSQRGRTVLVTINMLKFHRRILNVGKMDPTDSCFCRFEYCSKHSSSASALRAPSHAEPGRGTIRGGGSIVPIPGF